MSPVDPVRNLPPVSMPPGVRGVGREPKRDKQNFPDREEDEDPPEDPDPDNDAGSDGPSGPDPEDRGQIIDIKA